MYLTAGNFQNRSNALWSRLFGVIFFLYSVFGWKILQRIMWMSYCYKEKIQIIDRWCIGKSCLFPVIEMHTRFLFSFNLFPGLIYNMYAGFPGLPLDVPLWKSLFITNTIRFSTQAVHFTICGWFQGDQSRYVINFSIFHALMRWLVFCISQIVNLIAWTYSLMSILSSLVWWICGLISTEIVKMTVISLYLYVSTSHLYRIHIIYFYFLFVVLPSHSYLFLRLNCLILLLFAIVNITNLGSLGRLQKKRIRKNYILIAANCTTEPDFLCCLLHKYTRISIIVAQILANFKM